MDGRPSAQAGTATGPWAFAVLAAALAVQLAIGALGLPPSGRKLTGDEAMYVEVASEWAAGRPALLEPLWPPGEPALLALWIAAFGSATGFLLIQVAAHLAAAATLGRLATRVSGDRRVGLVAAALLACDPQVAAFAQTYWPESLHLAAALVVFELALVARPSARSAGALGGSAAVALLLKSVLAPFLPILVVGFLRRVEPGRRLRLAVVTLALLAVVLAPVVEHNRRRHGFAGVSDSAAFNVVLGLSDRAPGELYREYQQSGESFAERRQEMGRRAREIVAERGWGGVLAGQFPRQYVRLFDRESFFAASLPGGSFAVAGRGFRDPPRLLATALGALGLAFHAVVLAAAPAGLARLTHGRRPGGYWALAWLGYLLALFYFLHVKARYRVLLLPALDLGAAIALVELVRPRGEPRPLPGGWRAAATVVAATLLALGFGGGWSPGLLGR